MIKRNTIGEVLFWSVSALAFVLYWASSPIGLPWQATEVRNPYWDYVVAMADGNAVLLTCGAAAVSAGLLGTVINRYFGWRTGIAAAFVWVFMPGVWERAITGARSIFLAAVAIVLMWALNALFLWITRKARVTQAEDTAQGLSSLAAAHAADAKRGKMNRVMGWILLGAAAVFAVASATLHDYQLGEAASAYARLVVAEAGDRVILMNGLCDEQIARELMDKRRAKERSRTSASANDGETMACVSFKNDESTRSNLVDWVKREWPDETNLWVSAEIGPEAFAELAVRDYPNRLYVMNGQSTTLEKWTIRWRRMTPYLTSRDPFIPMLRRAFAYEGNYLGNVLQEKGNLKAAWDLYLRIFEEINPRNPAACVNLNEMLRRGYKTDAATRQRIESAQADYAKLMTDKRKAAQVAARIAQFGPVMRDEKEFEKMRARAQKLVDEMKQKGAKIEPSDELKTLGEWHVEMMTNFHTNNLARAVAVARAILSRPRWRGFVPAHMVMGAEMARRGNYVASERFYRVAIDGEGVVAPTPFIFNDYADVLRNLKRLDEAERYARKAVAATDDARNWLFCVTLAQILRDAGKNSDEVKTLIGAALKQAPKEGAAMIRREFVL